MAGAVLLMLLLAGCGSRGAQQQATTETGSETTAADAPASPDAGHADQAAPDVSTEPTAGTSPDALSSPDRKDQTSRPAPSGQGSDPGSGSHETPPASSPPAPSETAPPAPSETQPPKPPEETPKPRASGVVDPGGLVEVPATKAGLTRVGSDRCKLCHKLQYDSWSTTAHAKRDPPLDCESCHGAGSEYKTLSVMKDPEKARAAGLILPGGDFCTTCHRGGWSEEMRARAHAHKTASTP